LEIAAFDIDVTPPVGSHLDYDIEINKWDLGLRATGIVLLGAGKYNDGAKENRLILAERLADGMKRAFENTKKKAITSESVRWDVEPVSLPPALNIKSIGPWLKYADPAFWASNISNIAWKDRIQKGKKTDITCLKTGKVRILGLPGEAFIEYQLLAKAKRPDLFVAVAAYGDYGAGYIPTDEDY